MINGVVKVVLQRGRLKMEIDQNSPVDEGGSIYIVWNVGDVKALKPDISDDGAKWVLERVYWKHQADVGVNWDVIQYWIDQYEREVD